MAHKWLLLRRFSQVGILELFRELIRVSGVGPRLALLVSVKLSVARLARINARLAGSLVKVLALAEKLTVANCLLICSQLSVPSAAWL